MIQDLPGLFDFVPRFAGTPDRQGDLGFHQGVVVAWDSATGANTVAVAGGEVSNIPVMSTADSIMLDVGDNVGLLRFKSTYFILGRIAPPGAGAALGIKAAAIATLESTNSTTFVDLATPGPTLTDIYIGSSRRCLVFVSVAAFSAVNDSASAHVAVSGASTINPPANIFKGAFASGNFGATAVGLSATRVFLFTAADGLNKGLNTFTTKYASEAGGSAQFQDRTLCVFPF